MNSFPDRNTLTLLLQLEALFHSKTYNVSHITHMLEIYSDLVQYFDNQKSVMKDYFLEKIQYVLSRPETIQLLTQQHKDEEEEIVISKRFSIYKRAQVREMKIQQEIQHVQTEQENNVHNLLNEYETVSHDLDKQIQQQLNDQNEIIEKRKMNRKNKTTTIIKSLSSENLEKYNCETPKLESRISKWKLLRDLVQSADFKQKLELNEQ